MQFVQQVETEGLILLCGRYEGIDERLIERASGRTFRISGGGFWQVHKKAAEVLSGAVNEMIAAVGIDLDADNLDLYGGVGLFTGTIAAKFGKELRMTTVESFRAATEDATLNLADLPKVKAVCSATERFLNERVGNLDKGGKVTSPRNSTIVLDPPRAGAGAKRAENQRSRSPDREKRSRAHCRAERQRGRDWLHERDGEPENRRGRGRWQGQHHRCALRFQGHCECQVRRGGPALELVAT